MVPTYQKTTVALCSHCFLVRHIWLKMAKNDYLGPKLIIFGTKILILSGGSKSFGTHVTEKPPRHLVCIVFWSGIGSHGPKMPIFGQFWTKFGRFWAKNPFFGDME